MRAAHIDRLIAVYQDMTPESVAMLSEVYAANAFFKDPFNEVNGIDRIEGIFRHMYHQVEQPRFAVHQWVGSSEEGFIIWDMHFRSRLMRGGPQQIIHGVSHIRFDASGKVLYHRDYWDSGEELFAKLPLFGRLIGWLRSKLKARS
jgi:steroid delta-isomerase